MELALRCLEPTGETPTTATVALADLLHESQRWLDAAKVYESVWQSDHNEVAALYLAGDALQKAGRVEEGRQRKEQADLMALHSRARMGMARSLLQRGLHEAGTRQLNLVLRTAPFEHWEWHEAVRLLPPQGNAHPMARLDGACQLGRDLVEQGLAEGER